MTKLRTLKVYCSDEERTAIQNAARKSNASVSDFLKTRGLSRRSKNLDNLTIAQTFDRCDARLLRISVALQKPESDHPMFFASILGELQNIRHQLEKLFK